MHLLYLDDAGSAGNKREEYLVLGGVSVYEAPIALGSHSNWTRWRRTSTLAIPTVSSFTLLRFTPAEVSHGRV